MTWAQVFTIIATQFVSCGTIFYTTRFFSRLHGTNEIEEIKKRLDKLEKKEKEEENVIKAFKENKNKKEGNK